MAETESDSLESGDGTDTVPQHTDVGVSPPRLARRPHVEKPKEPARIRPDAPPSDEDGQEDDGDDEHEDADAEKHKKPGGSKTPKQSGKGKDDDSEKKDEKFKPDDRPVYRKPVFWILLVLLIAGVVAGVVYWLHSRDYESTDDAFIEGHAIQISPQVAARVLKVYVDDNTRVRAGDPLIDLDPTDYDVALNQARGNEAASKGKLDQAKANVTSSEASRDEARANLEAANVNYLNADRDYKRYVALDDRARSKQQFDNATTAQLSAAAQVAQAKAKVASTESQITLAVAQVAAAEGDYKTAIANRQRAEVNLSYCFIKAPGTLGGFARVTTKNVEAGQYAQVGQPFFSLVEENVWVVANFKETQLQHMRLGQPVTVSIDAYPDRDFEGKIDSLQAGTGARFSVLPAENATGNYVKVVQRIPVKITFNEGQAKDENHLLSPGMSVVPYVKIR